MDKIAIALELTPAQAWEIGRFLARLTFADYRLNAATDADAVAMQDAAEVLRQALAKAGINPA